MHFCFPIHSVRIPSFNYSLSQKVLNSYCIPDIVKTITKASIAHSSPSRSSYTSVDTAKIKKKNKKKLKDWPLPQQEYQFSGKTSCKRWHLSYELNIVNIYHLRGWNKVFQGKHIGRAVQWYERGVAVNNTDRGNSAFKCVLQSSLLEFKTQLCLLLAVWPQASHFSSVSPIRMGIITAFYHIGYSWGLNKLILST